MGVLKLVDITAECQDTSWDQKAVATAHDTIDPRNVIRLSHSVGVNHLVHRAGPDFDLELKIANTMLHERPRFFSHTLEVLLGAAPEPALTHIVQAGLDEKKATLLETFEQFVATVPGTRLVRDQARSVADELMMNGFDVTRRHLDEGKSTNGAIEFFCGATSDRMVLGCRDACGTLDVSRVLERIWTCFEKGVAQSIQNGDGGAGIGSYMVFTNSIGYYAGVDPGVCTVVCVSLPLGKRARDLSELPKNIHLIR